MAFSSMVFLFGFLPLTLLCYFLLPQRWRTGRNWVLLVFSLAFYAWGGIKLLPVLAVKILDEETSIRREIALVKVAAADREARDEVIQLANIFRAKVIDVGRESLTLGIFGSNSKITALIGMLTDYGILEIAKTGTIAIERGRSTIYDDNKLKEEYDYGKHVL